MKVAQQAKLRVHQRHWSETKDKVYTDNGNFNLKYTISVILSGFKDLQKEFKYRGNALWLNWRKCLSGIRCISWDAILTTYNHQEMVDQVSQL